MDHASAPLVVGLTGGIGMGKSTVSRMLEQRNVPVLDADQMVHELYAAGGLAVEPIGAAFPTAVTGGAVDRTALSACVVGNPAALRQLESIVHPLVKAQRNLGLRRAAEWGAEAVVLDIPLLFETGAEADCDLTVAVSAPPHIQRRRVLSRKGMSPEKLASLLARQLPDAERCRKANVVIDTGCSLKETEKSIDELVSTFPSRTRKAYSKVSTDAG
ncbi:COAE2 [Auxenochlorella protothecoides x Auxenochlorella symbiontica]